jgi:hypothetical protein
MQILSTLNSVSYATFVGIFSTVAIAAATISIHIWRQSDDLYDPEWVKKVLKHKNDRADHKLAEFVAPLIQETYLLADGSMEDEETIELVKEALNTNEYSINEIIEFLEGILSGYKTLRRPRQLIEKRQEHLRRSYGGFAILSLSSIAFALSLLVFAMNNLTFSLWPPDLWDLQLITLAAIMFIATYVGMVEFRKADKVKKELNDLTLPDVEKVDE